MSCCLYFPLEKPHNLLALGWLEEGHPYQIGSVAEPFYLRLKELFNDPWQPVICMGIHKCPFCQFDEACGTNNLFVPFDGDIFVAPELIQHYVSCHHYQPPDNFIGAIQECPDTNSMEYKRKLLKNGGSRLLKMMQQDAI